MSLFKDEQIEVLAASGWSAREVAGLPAVTADYLTTAFTKEQWDTAERFVQALRERFAGARFAAEVRYGVLLVPDPARLDTRAPVPGRWPHVFDERLPAGVLGVREGAPWTMVATVTGPYGPALGSYDEIAAAGPYTIEGVDVRTLMIRQFWGARVLQAGDSPPDWEGNERWTFTLFPGEGLTGGLAESGTVLKGKVRFRLGKADRGIGSARVAPALVVP